VQALEATAVVETEALEHLLHPQLELLTRVLAVVVVEVKTPVDALALMVVLA
jgi:hypothetical protein